MREVLLRKSYVLRRPVLYYGTHWCQNRFHCRGGAAATVATAATAAATATPDELWILAVSH